MKMKLFTSVAFAALLVPGAAYAQSTGSVDFNEGAADIVVTARASKGIEGIQSPDTTKAKGVLTQEFIAKQTPGNSILDTINSLPGVSFQNNDPFGSAGGTLTIRGFDASRISLTFDGIPLNDTGNYALYSNQQLDPELIEQVNVNYGSGDVDSPSASATGSTVNYRTVNPTDAFGARLEGSAGDYGFFRIFGKVDTGVFTPFGTKAWFSASQAVNDVVFNNFGKIKKQQYNAKIYQPIGSNGDFISVSGNYNENRNNFFGSAPLRYDTNVLTQNTTTGGATPLNPQLVTGALRTPGTGTLNRFPGSRDELPYSVARCQIGAGTAGVADAPANVVAPGASNNGSGCGTSFDERYNPSNTGSIRINSRFTLAPGLVLTVDPSFQYTKANGGGTVTAREGLRDINPAGGVATPAACITAASSATNNCQVGYFAGNPYVGKDLNGDGDLLDTVNVLAPSQTQTRRYGVIASLRYDLSDNHTVRVGYTLDRGRHRQTGEIGALQVNGTPYDVFPVNNPIVGSNGQALQKRDRLSYATLQQGSAEYRGEFFDKKLVVDLGVTAKFFTRDLTNYCFSSNASGFVECFGRDAALQGAIAGYNPYSYTPATGTTAAVVTGFAAPQNRVYKYNRVLPSAGFTYKFDTAFSMYANYSKGIQVPGTDNLYNAFYFPQNAPQANPVPETTDNFDAGLRYTSSRLQAQVGPWYTRFTNRLASSFDPDTQSTFYRNLGRVDKYGVDGSVTYRPIREITLYAYGSYLKSEIKNNVVLGTCTTTTTVNCSTIGQQIFALTAGKRESGSPVYTFGGRVQGDFGPITLGVQAKRTGPRYVNDQNFANLQCTAALVNQICPTAANTTATFNGTRGFQYQVAPAKAAAYTQVDIDLRVSMGWAGLNDKTYFQFNVQNLFNQYYVGGFSGGTTTAYAVPFVQIGSPRAFIGTLNVAF
ncbi:TonB-dependent receptor [Sphingomonas sp. RB3P16]|uniref:TonB-dependent receptor n=1 Tax=Parasphingomonas frigoris TaxID=3096163 RepID=UPI002FC63381